MNSIPGVLEGTRPSDGIGILAKERTIAGPAFNRWLVPPAALAIHLCIGMAYGFSVFWLPLSHAIGINQSVACPNMSLAQELFTTTCDWRISSLGWMFTLFFVFLGGAAAVWGGWLERAGPRKAGAVAALCWCGGLVISALGVYWHQLWMMWLGAGVIGGMGLGLGYISPVSTLIKWFPDRRGMATGMAIMGFGGGAMIGAPLANTLMRFYATPTSVGVWETLVTLAAIYFVFMTGGAFGYRIPRPDWKPAGWSPPTNHRSTLITTRNVDLNVATRTPQFWLIWWVLCLNVTAGIGVIGMASPMLQEVFAGRLIGVALKFNELAPAQRAAIAAIAAGFTGLLSLFNIGGRFVWASLSDFIGRKATYYTFFVLGIVNYVREYQLNHGVPRALVYDITMYVLCGLLVLGCVCNFLVRAVCEKHHMSDAEVDQAQRVTAKAAAPGNPGSGAHHGASGVTAYVWLAWLAVGIPLAWGVWTTLSKAVVLFR